MNLFIVSYESGVKGCPLLLKGDLNNDWEWDHLDPKPDRFTVLKRYEYQSKNPAIDFDFWNSVSIASEQFSDLCDAFGARTRRVPLRILESNGRETKKAYFYLLWSDWLSILDYENSEFEIERDLTTGEPVRDNYFPSVIRCESISKFVADQSKLMGKQVFKCIDLGDELVCNDEFKSACHAKNFVGLKFVPLEQFTKIPFWK